MATLFVMQGRDKGKRFDLRGEGITLGRDGSNRIQLNDSEISRRHAEVRRTSEGIVLADLASSNGTFVNLEKIGERLLKNGDRVQIGRTLLLFTDADDRSSVNLAHDVDIVGLGSASLAGGESGNVEGSRILKSVSHESGSQLFAPPDPAESPWLARARSNLQVMYRTALAVSHTLDIDQLLTRILDLIFEWVETDRGCIMLVDSETEELAPAASRNRKGARVDGKMSISRTILDYVMQHKEGVLTSDARDDERWNPEGSIVKLGVREAICVPMQGRYGIVGVIYIDTYTPPGQVIQQRAANKFSEEHLKLMVAIGHQAALAVEDTSYYSAMVQAERLAAMGQTIATLSHHIKNILQGIRGGSYLIEEGLKEEDNDVVRRGWRIVDKNQERISNLVMDMLTFSKDREPELAEADLNQTLADVVELMQARAGEAEVQLALARRDDLPQFRFDADLLHKAVLNVVTNAIDACEKRAGGRVEVSVEYQPGEQFVHIVVSDNGEGIAAEDLQRIFSVFESKKGSRGTGLGLPVSQKIMREHGGDIRVESTPGAGSRFYLELPTNVSSGGAPVNQTE
ncbi:MAG: ATP-binding protein [Planctomycetaceae bacterium]|nr:ATP-binding protein [Planctomycetaceae bacterium]